MGNRSRQQKNKQSGPTALSLDDENLALSKAGKPQKTIVVKPKQKRVRKGKGRVMVKEVQEESDGAEDVQDEVPSDIEVSDSNASNSDIGSDTEVVSQDDLENSQDDLEFDNDFQSGSDIQSGSDEEALVKTMFEDSDDDVETEFERQAKQQTLQDVQDQEQGDLELQTNIQSRKDLELPAEKIENEEISEIQNRIGEIIRVLNNFKDLSDKSRSRSDYVEILIRDLASYYGYNEFLAEILFNLFPLSEVSYF
jgi:25S rRNA (cytosine2870-C5)-methyltransferase